MKNSKAETIKNLENKLLNFYVPKTYFFNYVDWRNNSKKIFTDIKRVTSKNKIAIRSSAYDEDSDSESQAGKYLSFLNVNKSNKKEVKEKIEKVFKSYGSNIKIKKGQILIQEMIRNIKMSGVIMTQDLENSSPYYCINYDDITGSSDTVTSGKGEYANKSLYLLRGKEKKLKSKRFIKLIKAVQELEKKLKSDRLDIEFVLTKKNKLFLLQVRPLSKKKNLESNYIKKISAKVTSLEKRVVAEFKKSNNLYGSKNILGQMPDWNPVEMIGLHPSNLAYSLYDYLITDRSWYESRKLMGYKKINKTKLMLKLCGKPFIDIRKSFNSFLPDTINRIRDYT